MCGKTVHTGSGLVVISEQVRSALTTEGVIAVLKEILPREAQQCNYGDGSAGLCHVAPVHDSQSTGTQTLISFVFADAHLSLNCWHAPTRQSVEGLIITTFGSRLTVHVYLSCLRYKERAATCPKHGA